MERSLRRVSFDTTDKNFFVMNVGIISIEIITLLAHRSFRAGYPRTSWFSQRSSRRWSGRGDRRRPGADPVPAQALGLVQRGVRTPDQVCVGVPRVVIGDTDRDGDLPGRFTHRVNGRTLFGPIWLTQPQPARLRVGRSADALQRWLGKGSGGGPLGSKQTFRRRPIAAT